MIRQFKQNGEVLISTDKGARDFNLEEAAFVIHYDLPYNTLKMEQRIDCCHRLGQENDVFSVAFINQRNLSDARKLELASKRILVSNDVFGITDKVLGGCARDLRGGFNGLAARPHTKVQVEADYQETLIRNEEENCQAISAAEDVLFATFTRELAGGVNLSPRYVSKQMEELNEALWRLAKSFFLRYNEVNTNCVFGIDEKTKTVTATQYDTLPELFLLLEWKPLPAPTAVKNAAAWAVNSSPKLGESLFQHHWARYPSQAGVRQSRHTDGRRK